MIHTIVSPFMLGVLLTVEEDHGYQRIGYGLEHLI